MKEYIPSEAEILIQKRIKELSGLTMFQVATIVFGVIGLFFFIIPGLIIFAIGFASQRNNKNKVIELTTQLELIRLQRQGLRK